jgi:glycine betaine/proline transport system substrate-binding protein
MSRFFLLFFILLLPFTVSATEPEPGAGVTVQPGRATWNTGYFQEALVRAGLEELGYQVKSPKELQNPLFYQSLALGDLDYWANGWFPMHKEHISEHSMQQIEIVGYIVKSGGLQGYLVSRRDAEKFGITSLDDFKRSDVKKAFDANGDGKADLVACPPGWGCENTISYHLDIYDMHEHINPIKAGYTASMADALARYSSGKPVFFYTWAPNWTIFLFKPGEDVVWINVPEIKPRPIEMEAADRMTVAGVKGAMTDPAKLGFVVADIRVAANRGFLQANPAAKRFFQLFTVPLEDINEQNSRMQDGEKSQQEIERHAAEWITKNRAVWDQWLTEARAAAD